MTRTETGPPATNRLSRRRVHRRPLVGSVLGGLGLGLVLREVLGYPLRREAVSWLVPAASATRVGPRLTAYAVPGAVRTALWAYGSLVVGFAVAYGWLRSRS